jgi:hypothetical protein
MKTTKNTIHECKRVREIRTREARNYLELRKRRGDLGLLWGIHCRRRSCSA